MFWNWKKLNKKQIFFRNMADLWTKKYSPSNTSEVMGQTKPLSELKQFIVNFNREKKKAALVYGPTGCGKTSAVYALTTELGFELVELNASDFRNKEALDRIIGSASKQRSLFYKSKIILVDELDGIAGKEDRGGFQELQKLIDKTSFPIVMTANEPWNQRFANLRRKSKLIAFNKLSYTSVMSCLKRICHSEGIEYEAEALENLARRADGDLRAALTDLFILARHDNKLTKAKLMLLFDRRREISIIEAVMRVLKTRDAGVALKALDDVEEDYDELMLWLDENLPKEYKKPEELSKAYNWLSLADIFRGRIRRWQYWRFLAYIRIFLGAGVALAKKEKYHGFTKIERGRRILNIWIWNRKNQIRQSIAVKLADALHCSKSYAFRELVPFVQLMAQHDRTLFKAMSEELGLDEKEEEWLASSRA